MPTDWRETYRDKLRTPDQAMAAVRNGDLVVFNLGESLTHGRALARRRGDLRDVRIRHVAGGAPHPWFLEPMNDVFHLDDSFAIAGREAVAKGWIDFLPWPYGLTDRQFDDDRWGAYTKPDVFLVRVSAPNDKGYCSFGHGTWVGPVARRTARTIIAEVNPEFPHTYGDNSIHVDEITYLTEPDPADKISYTPSPPPDDEVDAVQVIGAHAASLIRDGDTLQVGTGTASQAVLNFLSDKNDLGIHSELTFPHFVDLEKAGNVTGRFKTHKPGVVVTTALVVPPGDPVAAEPYLRHVEMNPRYEFYDIGYICYLPRIAQQHRMVAVNNALRMDLTGQTTLNVLNGTPISGIGGHFEFSLGANYSKGGRSVTVLLSTARGGTVSRVVPQLPQGEVISMPRSVLDYVITEWGVVNLQGKSVRDRAAALISIAHPNFRDELRSEADALFSGRKVIV